MSNRMLAQLLKKGVATVPEEKTANQKEVCKICSGTGIYPGGLTHFEALKNPAAQHFNDYIIKSGLKMEPLTRVMHLLYFYDGDPCCIECYGKTKRRKFSA